MSVRSMPITKVKANLLRIVDDVRETGDEIVITRRGRPVAKLTTLMGSHPLRGALILPDDLSDLWSAGVEWRDPVEKYDAVERATTAAVRNDA